MDFLLARGRDFVQNFDFKGANGQPIALPNGNYRLTLERGPVAREYTENHGLSRNRTQLLWSIPAEDSADFEYSTYYYTLYLDGTELARGVLKVQ